MAERLIQFSLRRGGLGMMGPRQGVHELRQLCRRRYLDEDRHQQYRLQRSGRLRCREQPIRGACGRHLSLWSDSPIQGQFQHFGPHARAVRVERRHRSQGIDGRDQQYACLRSDGALAADYGATYSGRHRGIAGIFPLTGRVLRSRPHVLLGLQARLN